MSWQTALAQTFTGAADLIENGTYGIDALLTAAGWTLLDTINGTSGQTDRVYTSTGEDGSETLYIRIYQTASSTKIGFAMYTFWDSASHVGYNEVKGGGTPTEAPHFVSLKAASTLAWVVANKDGLSLAVRYDSPTEYSLTYIGLVTKRYIPTDRSGRTTLSAGVTVAASGTTNLSVVSETNIKTGQKIFIIDQTAGANAGNLLRCTVTATASGQITVTNDSATATAFDSGALVGLDPMPTVFIGHGYAQTSWTCGVIHKGATMLYGMDTTRMTGTAQTLVNQNGYGVGFLNQSTFFGSAGTSIDGSNQDTFLGDPYVMGRMGPDVDSKFLVQPILIVGGFNNSTGSIRAADKCVRGSLTRIAFVPKSASLAAEDVLTAGTAKWTAFIRSASSTSWWLMWGLQTVA